MTDDGYSPQWKRLPQRRVVREEIELRDLLAFIFGALALVGVLAGYYTLVVVGVGWVSSAFLRRGNPKGLPQGARWLSHTLVLLGTATASVLLLMQAVTMVRRVGFTSDVSADAVMAIGRSARGGSKLMIAWLLPALALLFTGISTAVSAYDLLGALRACQQSRRSAAAEGSGEST